MPELAAIFRYPIKSCRGRRVSAARLDRFGIEGDRRYLIVDGGGRFITQRETPALARIEVEETATHLRLRAPGAEPVCIPLAAAGESRTRREVTIWRDTVTADDLGEPAATWLSRYLGTPARLVTTGKAFHRPIARAPGHETAFADAWPLLVLSEASLQALNERLARPVPLDRFRPNLLVT
ncbi:MAG: MOSC domain-containing protein, partial [Verrucomicrobia bacterium]